MRAHQTRAFGEELERRIAGKIRRRVHKCLDRFLRILRRRVARSLAGRHDLLQVRIHRHGDERCLRARTAGSELFDFKVFRRLPELVLQREIADRGRYVHLIAQVMQHVHDRHAGRTVRRIWRELIASDAPHLQIRQRVFQRIADFDARASKCRIQDDEDSAGWRVVSDFPLLENARRLRLDRTRRVGKRDDLHIDAGTAVEIVRHAAELSGERVEDICRVTDARMLRLCALRRAVDGLADGRGWTHRIAGRPHRLQRDRRHGDQRKHSQQHERAGFHDGFPPGHCLIA